MKHLITTMMAIAMLTTVNAQNVVNWNFSSKKIDDKTYELHFKAAIQDPWHIYSQQSPKGGPLPTAFTIAKNPLATLSGKIKELGDMEIYHDEVFDVDVYSYKDSVDFVQLVKLKSTAKTSINGMVEFMACTKEQCLTPQKMPFTIKLD